MQYLLKIFYIVAVVGLAASCRSTKKIQTAISTKDTTTQQNSVATNNRADSLAVIREFQQAIEKNKIDFTTFSAKVKVDFISNDGKKSDFNAFFRLYKDSILWVSVNAVLGIEAFRVLVTPDSIKVLNKLDKIAQLRSVSYLQDLTKIPFTFAELQNLIMGNPIFVDSNIVSYTKEDPYLSFIILGPLFKHLLTVNTPGYLLQHSKLDDVDAGRARTANIIYGDYESWNGFPFSTFRKITVSEKSRLEIEMKYKQFEFNEELSFPFGIPKNYKLQ